MNKRKAAFTTLGCKVNQYESEAMASLFRQHEYEVVDFEEQADVYVINTCAVTHLGNKKSRQLIRRANKRNPEAVVAVMGCYAQTAPGEILEIPGVDLVVGTRDRNRLVELVEQVQIERKPINAVTDIMQVTEFEELPLVYQNDRSRAFVKIQEGCNNYCSYCIIPYARGPLRSRSMDNILAEVGQRVAEGYQEVVLTGICIGTYGRDQASDTTLAKLIAQLVQIPELHRLRLGSIEPTDFTPELIAVIQESPKVCRHLHIPLQNGNDYILHAMNRKYNAKEYAQLIGYVRYLIPDIAITTDVIVGFPGETQEHFNRTYSFIASMEFAELHIFKYSPRPGTKGAEMPEQVSAGEKEARSHKLINLGKELAKDYAITFIGEIIEVIVEQAFTKESGHMEGVANNYLRVVFPATEELKGALANVRLLEMRDNLLYGELLSTNFTLSSRK